MGGSPLLLSDPQGLACRVVFNLLLGQIQACDRSPPLTSGGWQSDGSLTHPDKYDQSEALNCSSSDDCAQITWSIDVLVRQIKFYRADAQKHQRQGRSGGVQDHKYFYEKTLQKELKRLIALAKAKGCPYNPEADVEATRSFNYPTPYNY